MSLDGGPSSAPENKAHEVEIQAGDQLWNVLQSVGVTPTLQTEVTWKRGDSESVVPLSSDEWRKLAIGAKVKVENGKISVENPGYKPKDVEKKDIYGDKNISVEDYKTEQKEHDAANEIMDAGYENIERQEEDYRITKVALNQEMAEGIERAKRDGIHPDIIEEMYNSPDFKEEVLDIILRSNKLEKYAEFNQAIYDILKEEMVDAPDIKNMSPQEVRYWMNRVVERIKGVVVEYEKLSETELPKSNADKKRKEMAERFFNELILPISADQESIWNEYYNQGHLEKLEQSYSEFIEERILSLGDKEELSGLKTYRHSLDWGEQGSFDYYLQEVVYDKSSILYKIGVIRSGLSF